MMNRWPLVACVWTLGLVGCQQTERVSDNGDAGLGDAGVDGGAQDVGWPDVGRPDVGRPPGACEGNAVERSTLIAQSIEELHTYFGVESGLDGGELVFQEAISRNDGFECTNDLSALSYIVELPTELRPVADYDRVAVIWGLNGDYWIAVLLEGDPPGALALGWLPTSAGIELNEDTPEEQADELIADVQDRFDLVTIGRLDSTVFDVRFPGRSTQRIDAASSQQAIAALRFLSEQPSVWAISMLRFGFSLERSSEFSAPRVVSDEQIELDCLRTGFGGEPRYTRTVLAEPFGTGRTYECDVCPIEGICGPE